MSGAVTPNYEQEIRFAVVLYGGASLCIYINGIAQELLHMVRGTADLPPGEKLSEVEKVYRELGQIIGIDGPSSSSVDPDDLKKHPIRSRFVVDIISGTSAGGINGVALAKALALKCRDLGSLRKTWLDEAQIDLLLNDKGSDFEQYPSPGETTSLLNGERYYGKILDSLSVMNGEKGRLNGAKDFAEKIDLFVTATDLTGLNLPIQLSDKRIEERVHKTVFHFEYPSPEGRNEFDEAHDPMLAFAARCTSSFPVAFDPMSFKRIEEQTNARLGQNSARTKFASFFPAYRAAKVDFWERQFADGGYLDNRPFSYVTDLITYRSATGPTRRKLLFVDPFPEMRKTSPSAPKINFLQNTILAAMTLPRYEVIRGDIQAINSFNRRLDKLAALKKRDERDQTKQRRDKAKQQRKQLKFRTDFAILNLDDMVKDCGQNYAPYHHLRVYDTSDVLARMIARFAGFEADSDEYVFLRLMLPAWRNYHYDAYVDAKTGPKKKTENAFLVHFDTEYRLRQLNHARSRIDEKLRDKKKGLTKSVNDKLLEIRAVIEDQLRLLREKVRDLESRTRCPLLEGEGSQKWIDSLKERLSSHFPDVMNENTLDARLAAAKSVYLKQELKSDIDAVMERIRLQLKGVFDQIRASMESVLPLEPTPRNADLCDIHEAFHFFDQHDLLSLPFLEGSGAKEHAEIEVYRVSPADSELRTQYQEEGTDKLVGTAVGAFGGFLQREWREHDMMWGRLDGAERIITALLPEPKHKTLRDDFIDRAQARILEEEFSLAESNDSRDRIFYWLAQKLRERNVTDLSATDLVKRGQELLKEFPTLSKLVNTDRDFRTFLTRYYSPPPFPEPAKVTSWSARSLKILGRMLDDFPESEPNTFRTRAARASRNSGILLTNLLHFATPGSIGQRLVDHWVAFIALAAFLLLAAGTVADTDGVAAVGYIVLAACLAWWVLSRAFGQWLKGKSPLQYPLRAVLGVLVLVLVPLGARKLWEVIRDWEIGKSFGQLYNWASQIDPAKFVLGGVIAILVLLGLAKLWELKPWRRVTQKRRAIRQPSKPAEAP